ncbi:MAG: imidazoleglycerol-phosphate dehydratase HisB [Nitrospirae bacterium]|nr:imidazoleglycerol-phosphate dehydratase HisB [Nitrospirota bacterium]
MKTRRAEVQRKTTETQVKVRLDLDGTGQSRVRTTMPFLDHMLTLTAKHGRFDLTVIARGDTEVDFHHTVEDIGIVLGETVAKALSDKQGIKRYGSFSVPMDEAIARVDLDLSGRPYLIYAVPLPKKKLIRDFDTELIEEFFKAFVVHSGITLHVNVPYGKNPHHILEAIFKAFGRALDQAVQPDARTRGVPSTKGKL